MGKLNNLATLKMLEEARKQDGAYIDKNTYNLGEYDTSVPNGDGTALNPRKTEYQKLDGTETWVRYFGENRFVTPINGGTPFLENTAGKLVCSSIDLKPGGWDTQNAIGIHNAGGYLGIFVHNPTLFSSEAGVKEYFSANPCFIQYELANPYTETVIENHPIRMLDQNGEWWLREEWKKGLNLINNEGNLIQGTLAYGNNIIPHEGVYTIYLITSNAAGTVSISVYNADNTYQRVITNDATDPITFTWTAEDVALKRNLNIFSNATGGQYKVMLVKGNNPYHFVPHYGNIIREKDLSGIQLFPEGVNPAQTIGGDWEDKGTVTTSNGTVFHAYRRL